MSKFYRRADNIMSLETAQEAIQAGKSTPTEKNNDMTKSRKMEIVVHLQKKMNKKPKAPDQRVPRPPPSKFMNYTDLVSSRKDVFMAAE